MLTGLVNFFDYCSILCWNYDGYSQRWTSYDIGALSAIPMTYSLHSANTQVVVADTSQSVDIDESNSSTVLVPLADTGTFQPGNNTITTAGTLKFVLTLSPGESLGIMTGHHVLMEYVVVFNSTCAFTDYLNFDVTVPVNTLLDSLLKIGSYYYINDRAHVARFVTLFVGVVKPYVLGWNLQLSVKYLVAKSAWAEGDYVWANSSVKLNVTAASAIAHDVELSPF